MNGGVRLDVWLDVACLAKTRSQAKELCDGGKVEVNGLRAKSHRQVAVGDRIAISAAPGYRRDVIVKDLAETHVPKSRARELYEDVTPPPTEEELELRAPRRRGQAGETRSPPHRAPAEPLIAHPPAEGTGNRGQ